MAFKKKPGPGGRERREKQESSRAFNKPKLKITRTSASGEVYIDYKDTESLRKTMSGNGKILGRNAPAPPRWSSACSPRRSSGRGTWRYCRTSAPDSE